MSTMTRTTAGTWRSELDGVLAVLREHAAEVDEQARFPTEGLAALRASGLLGLLVPTEHGGLGGDLGDLVDVAVELGGACVSTALIWSMHCQQVDVVVRHASPALRADLLPRIAAGTAYLASVTTERVKGGHLLSAQAPIRRDGDRLLVERDAPVVTGGVHADGFLVTMRADEDAQPTDVSMVYLDRAQVDLTETGEWDPMGMRATHSTGLKLSGTVPGSNVLGAPGRFRDVAVDSMMPLAHLGWSASWLGGARGALRGIVGGIRDRSWPVDLGSELARERLARIRIDLELVGGYLARVCEEVTACRSAGRGIADPAVQIHLNVLKVAAAELTFRAADGMVRFGGLGRGYARNAAVPVERVFRDLRSASLNYADDRLLTAIGTLLPMDRAVRLA
jgi:acyl-CoA dehydrogenase